MGFADDATSDELTATVVNRSAIRTWSRAQRGAGSGPHPDPFQAPDRSARPTSSSPCDRPPRPCYRFYYGRPRINRSSGNRSRWLSALL